MYPVTEVTPLPFSAPSDPTAFRRLATGEELTDEGTFGQLHGERKPRTTRGPASARPAPAPPPAAPPPPVVRVAVSTTPAAKPVVATPPTAARISALEARLGSATTPEEISSSPSSQRSSSALRRSSSCARPHSRRGGRRRSHRTSVRRGILLSLEKESMLSSCVRSAVASRVVLGGCDGDALIARVLGRQAIREAAVFPVKVRDRVLNLLYVENASAPIGTVAFAALEALSTSMGGAYERVILDKKRGSSSSPDAPGEAPPR